MKVSNKATLLIAALLGLHLAVLFGGFVAPYDVAAQNRELPFARPSHIHFVDVQGKVRLRPSVCMMVNNPDMSGEYVEDRSRCFPIQFLIRGTRYELFGIVKSNLHLFGVDAPA